MGWIDPERKAYRCDRIGRTGTGECWVEAEIPEKDFVTLVICVGYDVSARFASRVEQEFKSLEIGFGPRDGHKTNQDNLEPTKVNSSAHREEYFLS